MHKVRFGIIGLGDIGRGHLKCLLHNNAAEVVALCDIEPKRLDQVSFFGVDKKAIASIPFFIDYRNILEIPSVDAVIICVPNYLHKSITLDALDARKHVLLEKPLAHTFADAKVLKEEIEKSKQKVQMGLVYRYSPFFRKMIHLIQTNIMGRVEMMWCKEFREPFPQMDWFYDKQKSGGTLIEKNTHHFDLFQWMTGSRPSRVVAMGGQNVIRYNEPRLIHCTYCAEPPKTIVHSTILDNAFVLIEYENGSRANLGLSMFIKPPSDSGNTLEIGAIGSQGLELMSNVEKGLLKIHSGDPTERKDFSMKLDTTFGHSGAFEQHVEFIACIRDDKKPFADVNVGYESFLVAWAAEKSIEEKRMVHLSEFQ